MNRKKLNGGGGKYQRLQAELDEAGITTLIRRVGPKWYEVHVNFSIKKKYRLRESANRYITRLHKKEVIDHVKTIKNDAVEI